MGQSCTSNVTIRETVGHFPKAVQNQVLPRLAATGWMAGDRTVTTVIHVREERTEVSRGVQGHMAKNQRCHCDPAINSYFGAL